jgi:hypothetical protein
MRIWMLFIFVLFWNNSFPQEKIIERQTQGFLHSVIFLDEINPIEKDASDSVNKLVHFAMIYFFENGPRDYRFKEKALEILLDNTRSYYDDSADKRRMETRRALCFIAMALYSEADSRMTFLEYAKCSFSGDKKDHERELLVEKFLGIAFLELLFKYGSNQLLKQDVFYVRELIETSYLDLQIKEKAIELLALYDSFAF